MGATLVAQAIAHWSHVSDRAFRVLIAMANTAKDQGTRDVPAGLYFGGHDALILALAPKPGTTRDSSLRTVRRATDELEEVGAIRVTDPAASRRNAVYQLTLGAIPMPRKKPNSRADKFPDLKQSASTNTDGWADNRCPTETGSQADTGCPIQADTGCPTRPDNRCPIQADTGCPTPIEEPLEEPIEEREEEEGADLRTDPAATRARTSEHDPPNSICPNPDCLNGNVIDRTAAKGKRIRPCPTCRPDNVIPFGRRKPA